jgi:hypothetical protein
MKKHLLLALGVAAIYFAAREYGIHSFDDLKKKLRPYLGALDIEEIIAALQSDSVPTSPSFRNDAGVSDVPHES